MRSRRHNPSDVPAGKFDTKPIKIRGKSAPKSLRTYWDSRAKKAGWRRLAVAGILASQYAMELTDEAGIEWPGKEFQREQMEELLAVILSGEDFLDSDMDRPNWYKGAIVDAPRSFWIASVNTAPREALDSIWMSVWGSEKNVYGIQWIVSCFPEYFEAFTAWNATRIWSVFDSSFQKEDQLLFLNTIEPMLMVILLLNPNIRYVWSNTTDRELLAQAQAEAEQIMIQVIRPAFEK